MYSIVSPDIYKRASGRGRGHIRKYRAQIVSPDIYKRALYILKRALCILKEPYIFSDRDI